MRGTIGRYGLAIDGTPRLRHGSQEVPVELSPAWIINSVLGLRDEEGYLAWFSDHWGAHGSRRAAKRWIGDGTIARLASAAERTRAGGFPYSDLADLLEKLRFTKDTIEAPSVPALAAWALEKAFQAGHDLVTCDECQRLWFSRQSQTSYCRRPAPGKTMTCTQLHKHERFAAQREGWNKEYRKIYARKLRGSVSEEDWAAWHEELRSWREVFENPAFWVPFDQWKETVEQGNSIRDLMDKLRQVQESTPDQEA